MAGQAETIRRRFKAGTPVRTLNRQFGRMNVDRAIRGGLGELSRVDAVYLRNLAKAAIMNALPEDEPDTIPNWCYDTIIRTVVRAAL